MRQLSLKGGGIFELKDELYKSSPKYFFLTLISRLLPPYAAYCYVLKTQTGGSSTRQQIQVR
jgi:hypothetical protein